MPEVNHSVARQWAKIEELDAAARHMWDKVDREKKKLVRLAKLGRRKEIVVPISENRGVEIRNEFREGDKVFAPAFARKWKIKEVPLKS